MKTAALCIEEFAIAINGPCISKADSILKEAMDAFFSESTPPGKWKFFRNETVCDQLREPSGVLKRLQSENSKLKFMDN